MVITYLCSQSMPSPESLPASFFHIALCSVNGVTLLSLSITHCSLAYQQEFASLILSTLVLDLQYPLSLQPKCWHKNFLTICYSVT